MRTGYAVVAATLVGTLLPQGSAPRRLGAPTATFDGEFSTIAGVRELSDGRVLLLDARETTIQLIDLKAKTAKRVGGVGDGPGEYRLPLDLYALPGDSTAVYDMARFRKLLVVTRGGATGGFVATLDSSLSVRTFVVKAIDGAGRFYELAHVGPADSSSIVRWDRASARRDTIARIWGKIATPIKPRDVGYAPPRTEMRARAAPRPYYTMSQWAVSGDGRLALVTLEPYRVSYVGASGGRVRGPVMPVVPVAIGEAEKAAYRVERQRPVATLSDQNGAQTTAYRRPRYEEPDEWPEVFPAFLPMAVSFATDGMLWVKRSTRVGAPALFDVFNPVARLAYQVELPAQRRLVGFGRGTVYLARVDNDDLHYLERYALPSTPPAKP